MEIKIGTIDFSVGGTKQIDKFPVGIYQDLDLFLDLTVTITGGTTSGTPVAGGAFKIIRNMFIVKNGKTLKQIDGEGLKIKNLVDNKKTAYSRDLQSGDIGSYSVQTSLEWNFESEYLLDEQVEVPADVDDSGNEIFETISQQKLTALPVKQEDSVQLVVEWGTLSDLLSGGDRTVTVSGNMTVVARILEGYSFDLFRLVSRDSDIEEANVAVQNDWRKKLPQSGDLQRLFIYHSAGDAGLSRVKIYADTSNLLFDVPAAQLKQKAAKDTGVDLPSGWFLVDLNSEGKISKGLLTRQYALVEIALDVSTNGNIEIYVDDIVAQEAL